MAVQVNVSIPKDTASPALRRILNALGGGVARELNASAGRAAVVAAVKYHREFDRAGGWRGKRYMGAGGEGSSYGADVARGWAFQKSTTKGATIVNDANYYAFKVTGGTIVAKRWDYLTIPVVPEARGLYVKVYKQNTGKKLFQVGRTLVEKTDGGALRTIYALVKSVTMGPWPGAVPPEGVLLDAYITQWRREIETLLDIDPE